MPRDIQPEIDERVPIAKGDIAEVAIPDAMSRLTMNEGVDDFTTGDASAPEVVPFPLPAGFSNPETFVKIWRKSAALQPPIEAYASDVHGMGHEFEPVFDAAAEDALEQLREAHELHRAFLELYGGKEEKDLPDIPSDEDLKNELEDLKREARKQYMRAKYFFQSAVRETSWNRHRRNTSQESETGGNWYWEVVRKNGVPMRLKLPPFQTMRALKEDKKPTKVTSAIQVSTLHWEKIQEWRRFRRYVQKDSWNKTTYFKQYRDPRSMCAHCGKYYPRAKGDDKKAEAQAKAEGHRFFRPATEIMHDGAMYVPGSPYFYPRWLGAIDYVLGEEAASSANVAYFNRPMPAGLILCAGGKFAEDLKEKIETFMQQMVVGSQGFHRILTISAVAENPKLFDKGGTVPVNLQWIPLTKDRPQDAMFLEWLRYCEEKTGRQFRLHTLLFGGSGRLNKATAWAVLKFAEERVYQPLRTDFDELINRTLMVDLGITLWRFKSKAPETRDPAIRVKIYDTLQKGPALSIDQLLDLAGELVNRKYPPINKDWSKMPWKAVQYAHEEGVELDEEEEKPEPDTEVDSDEFEDREDAPRTDESEEGD